jgi:hypothetical protein
MNIRLLTDADAANFQALRLRGLAEAPQAFAASVEDEGSHRLWLRSHLVQAAQTQPWRTLFQ